jgi:hypothetical protein
MAAASAKTGENGALPALGVNDPIVEFMCRMLFPYAGDAAKAAATFRYRTGPGRVKA